MFEVAQELSQEVERLSTGVAGSEAQDDFIISKNALNVIAQIKMSNEIPEDYFLRISTRSGGCSGMNYSLGFDSEVSADADKTYTLGDLKLVIDTKSLFYIQGVSLDYVEGPAGSGFVFNNPNNSHACGCSH